MPIPVACPNCGTGLKAPDSAAGRQVKCPKCQTQFGVPYPAEAMQPSAPPPMPHAAHAPAPPRQRRDDYDDDYDDEPAPRRRRREGGAVTGAGGLPMGLGIAALAVGVIGATLAFIPCIGWYLGLPFAGIGLVMGLIGFFISAANKWQGIAFPAAGSAISLVGVIICVGWWLWWGARVREVAALPNAALDLQRQIEAKMKQNPINRPDDPQTQAAKLTSSNNLKQIGLALHVFNDAYRALPQPASDGKAGAGQLSWRVALLPYIEEGQLFNQFRLNEPWDSPHNIKLLNQMPQVYASPRGGIQAGHTFYQVVTGPNGVFKTGQKVGIPLSFKDGTSNTILVVEAGQPVPWTKPADLAYTRGGPLPQFGGMFGGDFNVVMGDGSWRFLRRDRYNDDLLRKMIDPDDGQVINFPD